MTRIKGYSVESGFETVIPAAKNRKELAMSVPTESVEQQCLFRWAGFERGKYPELELMYHIPNEGKRKITTGRKLKAEGLKSGVPDIHLPVPRGKFHGMYIELKRIKGSGTTENQDYWLKALNAQGYYAVVCRGWEEASKEILNYLGEGELV